MSSQPKVFEFKRLVTATRNAIGKPAAYSAALMVGALLALPAQAQLAGGIKGKVSAEAGAQVEGVKVTATSNVMPKARTVSTAADGSYNLPLLVPGKYLLTFEAADGSSRTVNTEVLLEQTTRVDMVIDSQLDAGEIEEVFVTGNMLVLEGNASLSNAISNDVIMNLPVGQNYRDLIKLIPGVQYTEDSVRGPSAGGSGQDNVYRFDGVDVSLPGYGVLDSEPSNHDVEMASISRGGAGAVGFNRAGGFLINTKSKSGTDEFKGSVEYKFQTPAMVAKNKNGVKADLSKSWMTANVSGPLVEDQLYFYGSFYRPYEQRDNKDTAYGAVKEYESERQEYFGKLTYAPLDNLLINASYRLSDRENQGESIGQYETDDVSYGSEAKYQLFILDGSWVFNSGASLSVAYNTYSNKSASTPDNLLDISANVTDSIDPTQLDQLAYVTVPSFLDGEDAYNAFITPIVNQYGYDENGVKTGGGGVGAYYQIDEADYYRDTYQVAFDHSIEIGSSSHELHLGYQYTEGREVLDRESNGYGRITVPGGRVLASDGLTPVYFESKTPASFFEPGRTELDTRSVEHNIELNDIITYKDFTFNVGVLISNDTLYGQGLRENSASVTGFDVAPGNEYEMYNVPFSKMIQPRLGVTWQYAPEGTVFANYAVYNPSVSSLARAASWDRYNALLEYYVRWDENGDYIEHETDLGTSGKFFVPDMDPRKLEEITLGTTRELNSEWSVRAHVRYKEGSNFWEDVPNNAREYDDAPADLQAKGLYIPELQEWRDDIGGSSYVIATLDDAYTKYLEFSVETEWKGDNAYLNASYVHGSYKGNFDQDNSTTFNDQATYVGSSYIADGYGRQTWNFRDGTLRGDRPHQLKVYGYYTLPWQANLGAYFVYQSGQPWETWDGSIYGSSISTSRYAEKAGSRRSAAHYQLDLNYTQSFNVYKDVELNFRADLFNVFNKQTGYNINPVADSESYGEARNYFAPRSLQLSLGMNF